MNLKQYDLYVARTIIICIVVVLLCIGLLLTMFALVDETQGVSETRSFATIVLSVLSDLPIRLTEVSNYIVLMGGLIGLGTLSQNSEVTVLRASGVSPIRLCLPIAVVSILFYLVMVFMTETTTPALSAWAAQFDDEAVATEEGVWYKESNIYTRINALDSQLEINRLLQFETTPNTTLSRALTAEGGSANTTENSFELRGVAETQFFESSIDTRREHTRTWEIQSDLLTLKSRLTQEPSEFGIVELYEHIQYLENEGQDTKEFEISLWTRLAKPLSILGLIPVIVGFVLGPLRETGMGTRIAVGLGVGIFLEYFQRMLIPLASLYGLHPIWVVFIPLVLIFGCGGWLLRKTR